MVKSRLEGWSCCLRRCRYYGKYQNYRGRYPISRRQGIGGDIRDSLYRLPKHSFEWKIAAYRAVVAAITYNEQRHLTTGARWFPTFVFCQPGKLMSCRGNLLIGRIRSGGEEFDVVRGPIYSGLGYGLGCFYSGNGVSDAWTHVSFRSVGSRKAATYISKQFGKLLFEVSYGGTNCDWEWIA